jgi:N-acetylglucosaminyl-diphospho-decaprenol L-rhamnosyltransferase
MSLPLAPNVSVVIVAYHGDRWIAPCVESLLASTELPVQILLVDNDGNTALAQMAKGWSGTRVIRTAQPLGFAAANNFALRFVDPAADAVCFLNQDTISAAGWLDACVQLLRADARLGAVVPLTYTYDGKELDAAFKDCASTANGLLDALSAGQPLAPLYEVSVAPAAAMVVKTAAIQAAGAFDPVFGSYYEDYDLCRRLRGAGYAIGIATAACIQHFGGSAACDAAARSRRGRQIVRNRVLHEIRSAGADRGRALIRYFAATFPRRLARSLVGRSAHSPMQFLAGHLDLIPLVPRLIAQKRDVAALQRDLRGAASPESVVEPEQVADDESPVAA